MDEEMHVQEKCRLDEVLVSCGHASSRTRAQDLIRRGSVMVDGRTVIRPGERVRSNADIQLLAKEDPWVSRGATKLLGALERFRVDPKGRICLDLGSSTGGFTQVLLSLGAERVIAVDVGTDQLADLLRNDPRVEVREGTHVSDLTPKEIPYGLSLVVMDLSFISLTKIFPILAPLLPLGTEVIALVKPQFEVGKDAIKKGIVRDAALRDMALRRVITSAEQAGFVVKDTMDSPIEGAEGNREFLAHLTRRTS